VNRMKAKIMVLAFIVMFALSGCGSTKWDIFKDGKFSISYPVMNMGKDLNENLMLQTGNSRCMLLVNKYPGQSDVKGFANYIKDLLTKEPATTITSEDINDSEANFELRVIYSNKPYISKVKLVSCEGAMYNIMMNCQENGYEKNAQDVESTLSSVKCSE